jgi:putative transposase
MPKNLIRYQETGNLHFVTFSCYQRRQYLATPASRNLFEQVLETMRLRYDLLIFGYVVMPEHVHLLLSEPKEVILAKALQALKLSVSVQSEEHPFWLARYYDFNVFAANKHSEKIRYMHENPVVRGLVTSAEQWPWSSCLHYRTGEPGTVQIESSWTIDRRNTAAKSGVPKQEAFRIPNDHK